MKIVSAVLRDIFDMLIGILLFGILFTVFCKMLVSPILLSDAASEEVGVERARSPVEASCAETEEIPEEKSPCALTVYREGDGPAPAWYRPDEEMSAEWEETAAVEDVGGSHPEYDSLLYGWDGHTCEKWEMDLFARIFYREFWQPNLTLCEAGCDAMLGLWDLYGGTMFETLSHVNENGSYTFSTYPGVWKIEYDPDGLAWCKAFCEERFYEGPVWPAQYFRKGQYHDWGEWSPIPAYEIDGIYFSIGKE